MGVFSHQCVQICALPHPDSLQSGNYQRVAICVSRVQKTRIKIKNQGYLKLIWGMITRSLSLFDLDLENLSNKLKRVYFRLFIVKWWKTKVNTSIGNSEKRLFLPHGIKSLFLFAIVMLLTSRKRKCSIEHCTTRSAVTCIQAGRQIELTTLRRKSNESVLIAKSVTSG